MADPKDFAVKTREQIRTDYTRTVQAGLESSGIPNANVSDGTLDYVRGDALGAFGEDIGNLVLIKANAAMPDSAGKDDPEDLRRWARLVKLDLRPAGPSIGFVTIETSTDAAVGVPTGKQLINDAGLLFEVIVPGPYVDGDPVQVRAIDTGEATNLEAGTSLRWVSPPPFVVPTALVATGGLVGGVDQEDVEGLRERLLDYLANPPGGGNSPQVKLVAESSSTFVGNAYVYPGVYGGNTLHVAVVRSPTATNKSRVVNTIVVDTEVRPSVIGAFPTFADITVTTVADYAVDAAFGLTLPTSKQASPQGPGGGWLNATPWPMPYTGTNVAKVISVTSSVEFVVRALGTPLVGESIDYVSPGDFKTYRGVIQSVSRDDSIGFPNDWRITIDVGFFLYSATTTNIAVDDWISPASENFTTYVKTVLDAFALLGPAEKTASAGLLPRALRRPLTTTSNPSTISTLARKMLSSSGDEVLDVSLLVAPATVPVATGYQIAPNIAKPQRIAFYPTE